MIVVSDATPLRYLIEIQETELLKELFEKVLIPAGVSEELQHQRTPQQIKEWTQSPPNWLEVRQADVSLFQPRKAIGKGEHQAIALAIELNADAILMDDQGASREATRANLFIVSTLSILEQAAARGLVDLPEVLERLSKTRFYLLPELIEQVLERHRQRNKIK